MHAKPVRTTDLKERKRRGEKITVLTAYDAMMARLLDRPAHHTTAASPKTGARTT